MPPFTQENLLPEKSFQIRNTDINLSWFGVLWSLSYIIFWKLLNIFHEKYFVYFCVSVCTHAYTHVHPSRGLTQINL